MSKINHTTPFRTGDRVRAAEIDHTGQPTGTHRTGTVMPSPADDGFVRVRVDGIGLPVVFAAGRLELDEPRPLGSFAEKVRLRGRVAALESGLTTAEIAGRSGVQQRQIEQYLNGALPWTLDDLEDVAPVLGASVLELLLGEEFSDATRAALSVDDGADDGAIAERAANARIYDALIKCVKPLQVIGAEAHVSVRKLADCVDGWPVRWLLDEIVLLASVLGVRASELLGDAAEAGSSAHAERTLGGGE